MTRQEAFAHLLGAQSEFVAANFAVAAIRHEVRHDPTRLPRNSPPIKPSHFRDCLMHLEPTYTLRLFAEFEGILRDYWAIARPSPRRRLTRMEILMARVAARVNIPTDALAAADLVREHRNEIIHGGSGAQRLTFEASKAALATFISFLPLRW